MEKSEITFDVALSFAGEDRVFVERVAERLKANNIQVFYDKDEEIYLWGKDLGDTLDSIYRLNTKFVVLFISEHYARKMWTNHERKSAFARAIQERREFVLPARFDDTELPGLRPTIGYISLRNETPETFALKIIQKITALDNSADIREQHQAGNPLLGRKEQIVDSLRKRLEKDFYTSGPRVGQFR